MRSLTFLSCMAASSIAWGSITWSSPSTVFSSSGKDATLPKIALHPSSQTAAATWIANQSGTYTVYGSYFNGSSWSSAASLGSSTTAESPQVGIDGNGNVTILFDLVSGSNLNIQTAQYASGSWGSPQTLSTMTGGFSSYPQLSVNTAGDGVATWHGSSGEIEAAGLVNFLWSSPYQISQAGLSLSSSAPALVGIDSSDMVYAILFGSTIIYLDSYKATTPPSTPTNTQLLRYSVTSVTPRLAINQADGRIAILGQYAGNDQLFSDVRDEFGNWSANPISGSDVTMSAIDVAINPNKGVAARVAAVWQTSKNVIQASFFDGSQWSAAMTLSSAGSSPSVAINAANNNIVVVWADLTAGGSSNTIMAREYTWLTRSWGSSASISVASATVESPKIAINASGFAMVLWDRVVSSNKVIEMVTSQ